nr:MAG TPA: hypothetical protein [Caudoviricetes sp.]
MVCHIVPCYTGIMKFSGDETKAPRFSCFIALETPPEEHSWKQGCFFVPGIQKGR